ncbi:unnamed protein product [Sphenostylis stenocarpa]|uniref:Uncharacterized protein n=1 Tax=Sphenostylis stenocarpa TaxID=92480 RepID=A0AA86T541_9FABA|nr:unnamed protein product [Sphenostylis stenocarpa]
MLYKWMLMSQPILTSLSDSLGLSCLKVPKRYGLLPFDLNACHHILPKILPSELFELIEKEDAKSIATMKEKWCLINERKIDLDVKGMSTDYLVAKTKTIKRSLADCNRFESQNSAISEHSNCSRSPLTPSSQKGQSKPVVMCSGSEKKLNKRQLSEFQAEIRKIPSIKGRFEYLCEVQLNQTYTSTSFSKPVCSVLEDSKEDQYKSVETANDASLNEKHESFDASCSQGSTSGPETAIQKGKKPMSGPVSSGCYAGPVEESLNNEPTAITFGVFQSLDKLSQNSDSLANTEIPECSSRKAAMLNFRDGNMETKTVCNLIDECSHANLEQGNVIQVLELTSGLTDLISEVDILFLNHQQKQCGIMEPPVAFSDEETYSWYDEQMMMSSVAEHGFCCYAKHVSDVVSKMGCKNEIDLTSEMLASSNNVMALGKLSGQDQTKSTSIYDSKQFEVNDLTNDTKRYYLTLILQ